MVCTFGPFLIFSFRSLPCSLPFHQKTNLVARLIGAHLLSAACDSTLATACVRRAGRRSGPGSIRLDMHWRPVIRCIRPDQSMRASNWYKPYLFKMLLPNSQPTISQRSHRAANGESLPERLIQCAHTLPYVRQKIVWRSHCGPLPLFTRTHLFRLVRKCFILFYLF